MDNKDIDYLTNKYPKSKNNLQCLGPCYKAGSTIVHPVTLQYVRNDDVPFCPVNEWEYINPTTGKKELRITDACYVNIVDKAATDELAMNIILPKIDFNDEHFLKIYYNIYSMEAVVDWIEKNKNMPYYSIKRVLDSAWSVYGFKDYILDDRLVIYYIEIIKKRWIKHIYRIIEKYIYIKDGMIYLDHPSNKITDIDNGKIQKINYIIDKFITYDDITRFLTKFMNVYRDNDKYIKSYNDVIRNELIKYIEKKIMISID